MNVAEKRTRASVRLVPSAMKYFEANAHNEFGRWKFSSSRRGSSLTWQSARNEPSRTELQARDTFLGFVAHDLRTPLTQISLRSALLEEHAPRGEEGNFARKAAVAIQRGTRRMGMLVGDLLDAAAIDSDTLRVMLSQEDLRTVLSDVVEDFRPIAEEREITLVFEGMEPVPAMCDRGRMAQSVGNLLSNAIKFMPSGGRIAVRIVAENGKAIVAVSDTGLGISAERLVTIMTRSWQTRTGERSGLGLGLYIARHIIHAHGGKLEAQSTVGAGSTFSFTVPCTQ